MSNEVLAKDVVAKLLERSPDDLLASELITRFRPLRHASLVWVTDRGDSLSALVARLRSDVPPAVLIHVSKPSIEAMTSFLAQEEIFSSRKIERLSLADLLRTLARGPRCIIATKGLPVTQRIDFWLRNPADRPCLERYFEDPVLKLQGQCWTLKFAAFAANGSVEEWTFQGIGPRVKSAACILGVPLGTFRFPYA